MRKVKAGAGPGKLSTGAGTEEAGMRAIRCGRRLLAAGLAAAALGVGTPASAGEYDPEYAGHPVRIVAYVLYPFGVLIDYLVLRPAHWLGSREPFSTIFGHDR